MRIVVDSNEFVFALTRPSGNPSSAALQAIAESAGTHVLLVSRFIVEEVRRHLHEADFRDFWSILLLAGVTPVEGWEIPGEVHAKYINKGLKPGDAAIAALVEATGAEAVLTENRDFHEHADLPFKVYRAAEFLKAVGTPPSNG